MIDEIIDQIAQTEEEIFSGKFCICRHLIATCHEWDDKCDALVYNGVVVSTCHCKQAKMMKFEIEVNVYVDEFSIISGEAEKPRKQVQLTAFTQIRLE